MSIKLTRSSRKYRELSFFSIEKSSLKVGCLFFFVFLFALPVYASSTEKQTAISKQSTNHQESYRDTEIDKKTFTVLDQPLTPSLPAKPGKAIVTSEWLLNLPNWNDDYPIIRWMNDTKLIFAAPSKDNQHEWNIELLDAHTGARKLLGKGSNAKPSPDQKWIAFTQGEKEAKELWIMHSDGSGSKQLSHVKGGHFEFEWSPDSKLIALAHQPDNPYWEKKKPPPSTINIINIKTDALKKIASFDATTWYLSWLPNGEELIFTNEQNSLAYQEKEDWTRIQALNITTGKVRTLAKFEGLQQCLMPRPSPDGKFVAFMYDADNPIFNYMPSLGIIPIDSVSTDTLPPITRLTHELKLYAPQWSPDSQHIYVRRNYGAYSQIFSINAKTGQALQTTNAPSKVISYVLSKDGTQIAWIGEDAQATRSIRITSTDGKNERELVVIPGVPQDMALSEVREVDWGVKSYPNRMRGLLFMPLNYKENTRYPLIVDIHGGGAGAHIYMSGGILVSTALEWHMWAAKGYAVFIPEFRSSACFGSLAITRDELKNYDLVNCDIKDIEAGIDELINRGIVNPKLIAVIGHSAGARRVNWLLTASHRFRAAISKEGWADEWIQFMSESPSKRIFDMHGGAPWEVPENYLKNSALYHCKGVTTPTLFLMGNAEIGGADPKNTVHMLYNAIKGQGVETEYVKYSDEGHVFEKPANRRDSLMRSIKWLDKHLNNTE